MSPPRWYGPAIIVLGVLVAIQMVAIVALSVSVAYLWGNQPNYSEEMMYGMPSPEEEELWFASDQMAAEVGYLIADGDLEGYMDLYDADDPHVDLGVAEADFVNIAKKAEEFGEGIEYMSDSMPSVYEDKATGETIIRVTVSGMDFMDGRPTGGRLTLHILSDEGVMSLTGTDGRDLSLTTSGGW